jgi:hypothetical protein
LDGKDRPLLVLKQDYIKEYGFKMMILVFFPYVRGT